MSKKTRKNTTSKPISKIKLLNIFLGIFLFAFLSTTLSYFILKNESPNKEIQNNLLASNKDTNFSKEKTEVKQFQEKKLEEYKKIPQEKEELEPQNFEEKTEEFKKDYLNGEKQKDNELVKNHPHDQYEKIEDDIYSKKDNYVYNKKDKPKLAVIIDDVSSTYQKKNILSIGKKINMAFLPPTHKHKNSARIAQDLPFHMIHFPMEASSAFKSVETDTLTTKYTYEQIEQRVKDLRKWYPDAKYVNNHTGSVFTQDDKSMDNLFKALKKYDFLFVDSRTTAKSKAKKYAKKYNMPYIVRNIFLDNHRDFKYIQGQLAKAVKVAKARGYAIAIGHPYRVTVQVLKESHELLKDVELVYINELPYL